MNTYIVYDETGRIYAIEYGEQSYIPKRFQSIEKEIEDGSQIIRVDVSNAESPEVITIAPKESVLEKELTKLKQSNNELIAQIEYLSMMSDIEMEEKNE